MDKDGFEDGDKTAQASIKEAIGMVVGSESTRVEGAVDTSANRADESADESNEGHRKAGRT